MTRKHHVPGWRQAQNWNSGGGGYSSFNLGSGGGSSDGIIRIGGRTIVPKERSRAPQEFKSRSLQEDVSRRPVENDLQAWNERNPHMPIMGFAESKMNHETGKMTVYLVDRERKKIVIAGRMCGGGRFCQMGEGEWADSGNGEMGVAFDASEESLFILRSRADHLLFREKEKMLRTGGSQYIYWKVRFFEDEAAAGQERARIREDAGWRGTFKGYEFDTWKAAKPAGDFSLDGLRQRERDETQPAHGQSRDEAPGIAVVQGFRFCSDDYVRPPNLHLIRHTAEGRGKLEIYGNHGRIAPHFPENREAGYAAGEFAAALRNRAAHLLMNEQDTRAFLAMHKEEIGCYAFYVFSKLTERELGKAARWLGEEDERYAGSRLVHMPEFVRE